MIRGVVAGSRKCFDVTIRGRSSQDLQDAICIAAGLNRDSTLKVHCAPLSFMRWTHLLNNDVAALLEGQQGIVDGFVTPESVLLTPAEALARLKLNECSIVQLLVVQVLAPEQSSAAQPNESSPLLNPSQPTLANWDTLPRRHDDNVAMPPGATTDGSGESAGNGRPVSPYPIKLMIMCSMLLIFYTISSATFASASAPPKTGLMIAKIATVSTTVVVYAMALWAARLGLDPVGMRLLCIVTMLVYLSVNLFSMEENENTNEKVMVQFRDVMFMSFFSMADMDLRG